MNELFSRLQKMPIAEDAEEPRIAEERKRI